MPSTRHTASARDQVPKLRGCTEKTGRSASPCAFPADSTRGMPRNRDGPRSHRNGFGPAKKKPPNDGSDDSAVHQRKGLPTSQVPLAVNERTKRLMKSQPSRVTSSRRGTAIIVDYSDLRWAKGGFFDAERSGKTRNSRRGGETRHHSRLTCERSEPITLELAAADLGSDSEDFPPATGIDPNRLDLLIDSHEGLGTHVKTNQKVQAERGIAVLVTQLGSNVDETGIEGWPTFGIKHLNTLANTESSGLVRMGLVLHDAQQVAHSARDSDAAPRPTAAPSPRQRRQLSLREEPAQRREDQRGRERAKRREKPRTGQM